MRRIHSMSVDVDIDLDDFDDQELIEILQERGYSVSKNATTPDASDPWMKLADAMRYMKHSAEDVAKNLVFEQTGRIV